MTTYRIAGALPKDLPSRTSRIFTRSEALEEMAVRWAVARITEDEIKGDGRAVRLMEFYTRKKDKKVMEMNTSFHEVITRLRKPLFGTGAALLQGLY